MMYSDNRIRLILLVSILAGCSGPTDLPTPIATTVSVSPTPLVFSSPGETQQLVASVTDQNGAAMSDAAVTWVSSAPSLASVSSTGLAMSLDYGSATIIATSGSASGTTSVVVGVPILEPHELCLDNPDYAIATVEDADLEAAIRIALSVGAGADLTCSLLSGLTSL